jgi:hypothetical protein
LGFFFLAHSDDTNKFLTTLVELYDKVEHLLKVKGVDAKTGQSIPTPKILRS